MLRELPLRFSQAPQPLQEMHMASFRRFQQRYLPFLPQGLVFRQLRNRLLRKIGLARAHEPAVLMDKKELRYDNLLPLVVAEHLLKHGSLTLLQIGANDGVVGDEIRGLIERYPIRGILVEPQPSAFERLRELHKDNQNLLLINAAIDCRTCKRYFFTSVEGDVQFASFDRNHLIRHGLTSKEITAHEVDCLTIDDVLRLANIDSVDLIQIDAEGYDYEIVKSIDFRRSGPKILRFEYRHFSEKDLDQCVRMLASHGYQFLTEERDMIAVRGESASGRGISAERASSLHHGELWVA